MVASVELFERLTRRYGKPAFGLSSTIVAGKRVPVADSVVWRRPFCNLRHFGRQFGPGEAPASQSF